MTIADGTKQRYGPPVGYITNRNGTPTTTSTTITWPNCVKSGSNTYSLRLTPGWTFDASKVTDNIAADAVGIRFAKPSNKSLKVQVVDSSGNAVDWTGIIGLTDLDSKADGNCEYAYLPSDCRLGDIYCGKNMLTPTNKTVGGCSGYEYHCKSGTSAGGSSTDSAVIQKRVLEQAAYVKVHIPVGGMIMYCRSTGSGDICSFGFSAGTAYSTYGSTTGVSNAVVNGGWSAM